MSEINKNYYGSLCTEMYEILHKKSPQDELNFYLSYAKRGDKILEPLCEWTFSCAIYGTRI